MFKGQGREVEDLQRLGCEFLRVQGLGVKGFRVSYLD